MENRIRKSAWPEHSRKTIARILVLIVLVSGVFVIGRAAGPSLVRFAEWVNGLDTWGPIVFIAGYALAVVAFAPGSLLTLAAGAIFGLLYGTIYVFIAATLGAAAAFVVSRYLARPAVEWWLRSDARFAAIDRAVAKQGRKVVFLLRL